jgi:hypothetical protein
MKRIQILSIRGTLRQLNAAVHFCLIWYRPLIFSCISLLLPCFASRRLNKGHTGWTEQSVPKIFLSLSSLISNVMSFDTFSS